MELVFLFHTHQFSGFDKFTGTIYETSHKGENHEKRACKVRKPTQLIRCIASRVLQSIGVCYFAVMQRLIPNKISSSSCKEKRDKFSGELTQLQVGNQKIVEQFGESLETVKALIL